MKTKIKEGSDELIRIPVRYILYVALIIVVIVLGYILINSNFIGSEKKATENLMNFFDREVPNSTVQINSITEQGSFYEFVLDFDGEVFPVYVTKDGNFMAIELIPLG